MLHCRLQHGHEKRTKKKEEKFNCTRSDPTYTSALWLYFQLSCVITVTHQQFVSRLRSHCSLFTNMVHLVPPTRNSRLHHLNGCLHQNLFFLSRFFSPIIVKGPKYKNTSPVQSVTFTDHSRHSFQNLLASKNMVANVLGFYKEKEKTIIKKKMLLSGESILHLRVKITMAGLMESGLVS